VGSECRHLGRGSPGSKYCAFLTSSVLEAIARDGKERSDEISLRAVARSLYMYLTRSIVRIQHAFILMPATTIEPLEAHESL
jgi:hypothetical protein